MKIDIRVTVSDFKESLLQLSKTKKIILFLIVGLFLITGIFLILLSLLRNKNYLIDGIILLCISFIILFIELYYDKYNIKNQIDLFNRRSKDNYIDYNIEFGDEIIVLNKESNNKEKFQYSEIIKVVENKNIFIIQMDLNMIQIITKRELSNNQITELINIFKDKNIKIKRDK